MRYRFQEAGLKTTEFLRVFALTSSATSQFACTSSAASLARRYQAERTSTWKVDFVHFPSSARPVPLQLSSTFQHLIHNLTHQKRWQQVYGCPSKFPAPALNPAHNRNPRPQLFKFLLNRRKSASRVNGVQRLCPSARNQRKCHTSLVRAVPLVPSTETTRKAKALSARLIRHDQSSRMA